MVSLRREEEERTLAWLGVGALTGLSLLVWQRHQPSQATGAPPRRAQTIQWHHALQAARAVDINTATVAELERLPDVGPALARRIVEHRSVHGPFRRPEELAQVKGIGPKTLAIVEGYVTMEPQETQWRDGIVSPRTPKDHGQ